MHEAPRPLEDPPPGPPWDVDIAACPFACVDCEMTGTDLARDALVEIAVVRVVGGRVETVFESLVHTEVACDPAAHALHGIAAESIAAAPRFEAVAGALAEALRGAVVVAHAPDLDVAFLDRAFEAAGSSHRLGVVLDTLTLARRAVHAHTYALSSLAQKLSLGTYRWHRAGEDARATAELLKHLVATFRPKTARDLWDVRVGQLGPVRVRASLDALFARYAGTGRMLTMLVRTPGSEPFTLRGRIERWSAPHLLFAPGTKGRRGLRILRADRVLDAREDPATR